jgi:hypothetical protein
MPKSAKCPTARNAIERVMPDGATGAQYHSGAKARPRWYGWRQSSRAVAPLRARAPVAPLGIRRSMALRAVWHHAPFGIRRPSCPAPSWPAAFLLAAFCRRPCFRRPYAVSPALA